jgi:hypothetical protein
LFFFSQSIKNKEIEISTDRRRPQRYIYIAVVLYNMKLPEGEKPESQNKVDPGFRKP